MAAGALGRPVRRLGAEIPGMPKSETTGAGITTVGRVTANCKTGIAGIPGKAGREIGVRPLGKPLGKPPGKLLGKTSEGRAIEGRLTAGIAGRLIDGMVGTALRAETVRR